MNALKMICNVFDGINEWAGRIVAWVTLTLVLIVFADVVMRYLFNTSFVFVQELEWHVFGFIFLMGAGYTLLHDGHVRVDIIYQNLSPRGTGLDQPHRGNFFHASGMFHGDRHFLEIYGQFLDDHGRIS